MQSIIKNEFNEHILVSKKTLESCEEDIKTAAKICIDCLNNGNKILIFGNGGNAADSQHIAAEIIGRYKTEQKACLQLHFQLIPQYLLQLVMTLAIRMFLIDRLRLWQKKETF